MYHLFTTNEDKSSFISEVVIDLTDYRLIRFNKEGTFFKAVCPDFTLITEAPFKSIQVRLKGGNVYCNIDTEFNNSVGYKLLMHCFEVPYKEYINN